MKKLIGVATMSLLISCTPQDITCKQSKGELIGYRVAKHSHIWVRESGTGVVYDIGGLGGRREPSVALGAEVEIQVCGNNAYIDRDKYVRQPHDRTTRYVGRTN